MRIVFAGTPQVAVPSLRAIAAAGHEIAAVVTRPDAPSGRGRKLTPSPVAQAAEELGIAVLKPVKANADFAAQLAELAPDVCPVVAYGALLPQSVLDVPQHGWVNLHFSLLPRWRGAAPVQRAIMAGEQSTGVTTFRLVRELDAGPIWRHLEMPIGPGQTAGELLDQLSVVGAQVLVDTLDDIAEGVQPNAQPAGEFGYADKLDVNELQIDWRRDAAAISHLVLGASPDPGAWTLLNGERFKILRAVPAAPRTQLAPGELHADRRNLWAGTSDGAVQLLEVQPVGKKAMAGADWARGVPGGVDGVVLG